MSKILNVSEAVAIALHSMALIAQSDEILNVNKIADITKFSKSHLAKVMQQLVRFNYLKSTRGPEGGYILAKKPEEISLKEIYNLIEGEIDNNFCNYHLDKCLFNKCVFGGLNRKFTNEFSEYLTNNTLNDIIK